MANINNSSDTNTTPDANSNIDYDALLSALRADTSNTDSKDSSDEDDSKSVSDSDSGDLYDDDYASTIKDLFDPSLDDCYDPDLDYIDDEPDPDDDFYDDCDDDSDASDSMASIIATNQENISDIQRTIKNQPVTHIDDSSFPSKRYYGMKVAEVVDDFFNGCDYKYRTNTSTCGFTFNSLHLVDSNHLMTSVHINYNEQFIQFSIKLLDIESNRNRKALLLNAINNAHYSISYGTLHVSDTGECYIFYNYSFAKGFSIATFEETWFALLDNASKYTNELLHLADGKLSRAETLEAVSYITDTACNLSLKCKNKTLAASITSLINRELTSAEKTLIAILADNLA